LGKAPPATLQKAKAPLVWVLFFEDFTVFFLFVGFFGARVFVVSPRIPQKVNDRLEIHTNLYGRGKMGGVGTGVWGFGGPWAEKLGRLNFPKKKTNPRTTCPKIPEERPNMKNRGFSPRVGGKKKPQKCGIEE